MSDVRADEHLVGHYAALGGGEADFRNANLFTLLAEAVKGDRVLDIGCGPAFLLSRLKARGKKAHGVEPSENMRALAREKHPDIEVEADSAHFPDASFDTVLMIDVLEHIEDDRLQAREVKRLLKAGGEFIVVVPAHPVLFGTRDAAMGHYRRYTRAMLEEVLEENGFAIESMRHWNALGFLPYFISEKILRRPLESKLRQEESRGFLQKLFHLWFRHVENRFDFGFGLSIISIAKRHDD